MTTETKTIDVEKTEKKSSAFDLPTRLLYGDEEGVAAFLSSPPPNVTIRSRFTDTHFGKQIFAEPYRYASGATYEKELMDYWLKTHDMCPETHQTLKNKESSFNESKREDVRDFLEEHLELRHSAALYLPRRWVKEFEEACMAGEIEKIQALCQKDKRLLYWVFDFPSEEKIMEKKDYARWQGKTIMHLACARGKLSALECLIKEAEKLGTEVQVRGLGLGLLLRPDRTGLLPIHHAILGKQSTEVLLTLNAWMGKQRETAILPKEWKVSDTTVLDGALTYSVLQQDVSSIQFFLKLGANQNAVNDRGESLVYLATQAGLSKSLEALLEAKVDLNPQDTHLEDTPLHTAVRKGQSDTVRALLKAKADPNKPRLDDAPLHVAVRNGHSEIVSSLLDAKADPNKERSDDTALHMAVRSGSSEIVRSLRKQGAKLEIALKDGSTPIHLAAESKTEGMLEAVCGENTPPLPVVLGALLQQRQVVREIKTELEKLNEDMAMLAHLAAKLKPPTGSGGFPFFEEKTRSITDKKEVEKVLKLILVEKVLKLVVEGEQEEADKLLKENPELLLASGKVTDLSGRTFESITAFQYAVWALDWHMWKMLLKHLPKEAAAEQLGQLEEKGTAHGKQTTQIEALINALGHYIENAPKWNYDQRAEDYWCKTVGGAQRLLPVHVVNEYCRADRSFSPTPNFLEDVLPRTRKTDGGEWFTCVHNGGAIGDKFAVSRGRRERACTCEVVYLWAIPQWVAFTRPSIGRREIKVDHGSLQSLIKTRAQQKEELVVFVKTPSGPSAGGSQR